MAGLGYNRFIPADSNFFPQFVFQKTLANWRKVWYVAITIYFFDAIFFAIFGSGEEQYWNTLNVDNAPSSAVETEQYSSELPVKEKEDVLLSFNKTHEKKSSKIARAKLE